jgi:uncharacterized repeat protein (TIGR03803 family)
MVFLSCAATASPAQTLNTLASFNGTNGSSAPGPVVQGSDGNFYGVTWLGGANNNSPCYYAGCGTVFRVTPAGTLTTLHNFNGSDGDAPYGALVQATDGNFYGTNTGGGTGNVGTIFKITVEGTLTTLHDFTGTDGAMPRGQLIQASDGNFYGVTYSGANSQFCPYYNGNGCGTVFKITPAGTLSTLYKFCSQPNCTDGFWPAAGLVQGTDGNFYGTTAAGGNTSAGGFCSTGGCGTVFKITPTGAVTTLYRFGGDDGSYPYAGLVQARNGNFYGTASAGGPDDGGTIFSMTPNGTLTTLYGFCSQPNCTDGGSPETGLIQGSDGNFYGTTLYGGTCLQSCGTVFKVTPSGTLTTLHYFNDTDGSEPYGGVIQVADGNLYGTTLSGGSGTGCGSAGCGVVFELELNPTTLAVSNVGSGNITSTDGLVNCPGTCNHNYSNNAPVTLNASPNQGWNFTAWSGACTGTGSCNLTINQNLAVTANFTQGPVYYTLTVNTAGSGSVTSTDGFINCPGTCSYSYLANTQVTLNASPASGWTFSGWTGPCMGIGPCNVTMTQPEAVTAVFYQAGQVVDFYPLPPCRAVDTRDDNNPIEGGTSRDFSVASCDADPWFTAYSLNVTVVPHRPLGYLTIWPTGEAQPLISTMNSPDGRIKANAAIVPLGNKGLVTVYVTDTSDVILDINGYFAPSQYQYQFFPLPPCRVVDTRAGSQQPHGLGPPFLGNMEVRELPFLSSPCLQGSSNPQAYSLNVTVVPYPAGQPLSYLTLWPSDQQQPYVSTLNNPTGTVVANAAIVPAAANGDISVFAYNSTDLVMDINGYFAAPGTGGLTFYPVAPCRVLDTRQNNGQPFSGEKTVNVLGSACAPPSNAAAYVFNATVVPPGSMPYLTLWPDGEQQPVVSTLNAYDGFITSNMAIAPTNDGSIDAYAYALTQLILDISGYFAP